MDYVLQLTIKFLSVSCIERKELYVTFKHGDNDSGMVLIIEKETGLIMMRIIEGLFGLYEMFVKT